MVESKRVSPLKSLKMLVSECCHSSNQVVSRPVSCTKSPWEGAIDHAIVIGDLTFQLTKWTSRDGEQANNTASGAKNEGKRAVSAIPRGQLEILKAAASSGGLKRKAKVHERVDFSGPTLCSLTPSPWSFIGV
jgi:hypothetical protein